jgi:hypothetical protein
MPGIEFIEWDEAHADGIEPWSMPGIDESDESFDASQGLAGLPVTRLLPRYCLPPDSLTEKRPCQTAFAPESPIRQ